MKRQNTSLLPSPEEEEDASTMLLYCVARMHYATIESISRFQAFVRGELEKRGYVEGTRPSSLAGHRSRRGTMQQRPGH
jgi:hypothetical protein